jgi:hypothetical protein
MFIRDLYRYLFAKQRAALNHGGRVISPYDIKRATESERLLIEAGIARSPEDARYLMAKHGATHAAAVLRVVKRRKQMPTTRERFWQLIKRLDGHDPRDAYGKRYEPPVVPIQYRYRGKR